MIITKQKPFQEIMEFIASSKKVYLIGCNICASTCRTGGETELDKMQALLEKEGKQVTGSCVLDPACSFLEVRRFFRKNSKEIEISDSILSLACGGGTQAIAEIVTDIPVFPGNDTLFQGEITKSTLKNREFQQKCSLCGDCMLALTGGICPVTRCPKGLVNGPCGGIKDGKCEIDPEMDCIWLKIYEKLKSEGKLNNLKNVSSPKDHSRSRSPQSINIVM